MLVVRRLFILAFLVLTPILGLAQEDAKQTAILNRLTHANVSVETLAPVVTKPVFIMPPGVKLLESRLNTTFTEKFHCELELILYFERAGNYNIGPFVFNDKEGNSYTVPPIKFEAIENEVLSISSKARKTQPQPVKFYTLKPQENLYPGSFIYFVLEIPEGYQNIELFWPGWEDVYTERLPEITSKNSHYEAKFLVFFNKDKKYNLTPLKIEVKSAQDEKLFSSTALSFDVKKFPEELELFGLGEGNIKVNVYTATQKNYIQLDVVFTGTGNLYNLKQPKITITPEGELLLKKITQDFLELYPEIKGKVRFSYIFYPSQDGTHLVKVSDFKMFNPKLSSFTNISGFSSAINVMLPSNPLTSEYKETLKDKLNIKAKPDYDFYGLIVGLLFITFLSIGLYLRTFKIKRRKKSSKKNQKSFDQVFVVQQAVLSYLKFFTGSDIKLLPLSQIKEKIKESRLNEELQNEIIAWLEETFKLRYLERVNAKKETILKQEGIKLLRKMKTERQGINF